MRLFVHQFVLAYLRFFAKLAIKRHKPTIIGITGSVGKSSTRNTLEGILKEYYKTKSVGNSETGIPLGILGIKPNDFSTRDWLRMLLLCPFGITHLRRTKYLIVEMGIDDPYPPKNMTYLLTIIKPDIAIVLNVGPTHTMQFEKLLKEPNYHHVKQEDHHNFLLTKIAEEKTKLITHSHCTIGIYNKDDSFVTQEIENENIKTKLLSFGKEQTNTLWYKDYGVTLSGTSFTFAMHQNSQEEDITVSLPLFVLPHAYQEVFAPAIIASQQCLLTNQQIAKALAKNFSLPKGRASIIEGIQNSIILDSSYNASKPAVIALLDLAYTLKKQTRRPLVFVFGDMRELGGQDENEHKTIADKTMEGVEYVFCIGPLTKQYVVEYLNQKGTIKDGTWSIANGTVKQVMWFPNALKVGEYLASNIPHNALVLVKGSQNNIFLEEAIKPLLQNKTGEKKLCRQEDFWMRKKEEYFVQSKN